jgi:hypothetical protein
MIVGPGVDRLGGSDCGGFIGPFDEFAVGEGGTGELIEHNHEQTDEALAGHLWLSGWYEA